MGIKMVELLRPNADKHGNFYLARKAIPKALRAEYTRLYGLSNGQKRWEAKLTLPATLSLPEAKARFSEWLAEVEGRISTIKARLRGEAQGLSHRAARALAGEWYQWFIQRHDDKPDAEAWSLAFQLLVDELAEIDPDAMLNSGSAHVDLSRVINDNRAAIRPYIADVAATARFLAAKGMNLTDDARDLFLDYVALDYLEAIMLLERRAKGDYSPDDRLQQFPKFEIEKRADPWALFEGWIESAKPAASTVDRWRVVFTALRAHFKEAPITEDAAREWLNSLINAERSARTVSENWLSAARSVYAWAVDAKKMASNPFKGIKIKVPDAVELRDRTFTADEARTILSAATKDKRPFIRWIPWLQAYSGARAGEITQLRGQDIIERDGAWCMNLTPEAGTIKTKKARIVPLHSHLIEQGFLDFVNQQNKGPLFYRPRPKVSTDATHPKRPQAPELRDRVAEWVRDRVKITDKGISPTHSWRHLFKQIADRAGISERVSDAITGHAGKTAGSRYGKPTVEDMAQALKKFPRYKIG
jgi:integrase